MMQLDAQIKVIRPGDRETRRLGDVKRDGETRDHISKKETKIEFVAILGHLRVTSSLMQ